MLTPIGKFLRKLQIDCDESLNDMANKLGVTSSFLSAVENGRKHMPSDWNEAICTLYSLDSEQRRCFTDAVSDTENSISLNLQDVPDDNRKLAITFARKFKDFDERQIDAISKEMGEGG